MRLAAGVHLVGGGDNGFNLSGQLDCHVYLVDGGDELALIDAGLGWDNSLDQIVENIRADGFDSNQITKLILTHGHGDHAGGAAEIAERLGCAVLAPHAIASALREGDEAATSLDIAKAAGFYPPAYQLRPCPIDHELHEGDLVAIGNLQLQVYETPGHSRGHASFLLPGADRTFLFGGDLVFWGGRILLQNIPDCSIAAYAASMHKMERVAFDALLPGHLSVSLRDGHRHLATAAAAFRQLAVPPNLL